MEVLAAAFAAAFFLPHTRDICTLFKQGVK